MINHRGSPRRQVQESSNGLPTTSHARRKKSKNNWKSKAWMLAQLSIGVIALSRYGWNLLNLHSMSVQEAFASSETSTDLVGPLLTPVITDSHNFFKSVTSAVVPVFPGEPDTEEEEEEEEEEEDPELERFNDRRHGRKIRTRPPPVAQEERGEDNMLDGTAAAASSGHDTHLQTETIEVALEQDWKALCDKAGLGESSRVAITGILSQPPGQVLALILGSQCGVKAVLGVDAMFTNNHRARIRQMEDYRILKRAIKDFQLIIPPIGGPSMSDATMEKILEYRPTHMIHIDTQSVDLSSAMRQRSGRHFAVLNSVKEMSDYLQALVSLGDAKPALVYIVSEATANEARTRLAFILAKAYHRLHGVHLVKVRVPEVVGPLAAEMDGIFSAAEMLVENSFMYVELAAAAILTSLDKQEHGIIGSYIAKAQAVDNADQERLFSYWRSETSSWMESRESDVAGNAMSNATYIESFGVHRNRFPCMSKCESMQCLPTPFDDIQVATYKATNGCEWVLYTGNFSKALSGLVSPDVDDEKDDAKEESAPPRAVICRIAFVSGKSELVSKVLKEDEMEVDEDVLRENNGELVSNSWKLVWLSDSDETSMANVDWSLLRIEPSALFPKGVFRVLYSESRSFLSASNEDLTNTFMLMERKRTGKRRRKVRMPGTNLWQSIVIKHQAARRVVFYGREMQSPPESLAEYARDAKTEVSKKQIEFYDESLQFLFSNSTRGRKRSRAATTSTEPFESFPYKWISAIAFGHDLTMKWSHDFRCYWLKEQLYWGGARDAEMLSLAYVLGRRRLDGYIGPSLAFDKEWIPLLEDDHKTRVRNPKKAEVFFRIVRAKGG